MTRKHHRLGLLAILWLTLGIWFFPQAALATETSLRNGWEYRWGDSPQDANGHFLWASEPTGTSGWLPMSGTANPPHRHGNETLWMRHQLPAGEWHHPVLFVSSIDLIGEAYIDNQQIFRHGSLDSNGQVQFAGWSWHTIPLPDVSEGKVLYLRIHSDYSDIGLWGKVAIMDESAVLPMILATSWEGLVVATFCLIVGSLASLLVLSPPRQWRLGSVGFFSLAIGIMLLAENDSRKLLLDIPLLWNYLAAATYFSLPIAMGLILEHWFPQVRTRFLRLIWLALLAYLTIALSMSLMGMISLSSTFPSFDVLLLISTILMALLALRRCHTFNIHQYLVLASYAAFVFILMLDMAVAHSIIDWFEVPVHFGALAFTLSMVIISLRHYTQTQRELNHLNRFLESEVAERTSELQSHVKQEHQRASLIALEHSKSQALADLIDRLQGTAALEHALEIIVDALPELTSPLRGAFYRQNTDEPLLSLTHHWPKDYQVPATLPSSPSGGTDNRPPSWLFPLDIPRPQQDALHLGILWLEPNTRLLPNSEYHERTRRLIETGITRVALVLSSISLQEKLATLSYNDGLTGLRNRRYFEELMFHEAVSALRNQTSLTLAIVDIDHFKLFNDRFGHSAGDVVLCGVAQLLAESFRDNDVVCRLGGEEFVILLPHAQANDALMRIDQMTQILASTNFKHAHQPLGTVSLSCGIASFPCHTSDPHTLLEIADNALYRAKQSGRARITMAE
ncbi:GGDEF domain-containing protein [Halomonas binhaiensis]|uniref:diguanylate cyclase n=1 Tax=Halomonas binhaiensis TaxID=2562282 RepID=A0A5C1NHP7_9GAMM|nr:GGDEF domain-containing protein [Halomonas binhaiensis]QEM81655.1 diguanylate cyclase [Halomonas binhaiensis]